MNSRRAALLTVVLTLIPASSALAAPGDPDPTFGTGGQVAVPPGTTGGTASALAIQPDGKLVVAGQAQGGSPYLQFGVMRFNADGTPDTSFDGDGSAQTPVGSGGHANDVLVQPDGKIVAVGNSSGSIANNPDFSLVRYNADGSLDSAGFGTGGKTVLYVGGCSPFNGYFGDAEAVARQPDGKLVVAGYAGFPQTNCSSSLRQDFVVARFNSDGTVDSDFGTGGRVHTPVGTDDSAGRALTLEPDGTIDVGGYARDADGHHVFATLRYSADGTALSPTFNGGSPALTAFDTNSDGTADEAEVYDMVRQPDGALVHAGFAGAQTTPQFALSRLTPAGALDSGFGTGGRVVTPLPGSTGSVGHALALDPANRLVVGGTQFPNTGERFAVARYTSAGTLDPSFGSNGAVVTEFAGGSGSDEGNDVAVQADGKIVAAGTSYSSGGLPRFGLARYEGGSAPTSGGTTETPPGASPAGQRPASGQPGGGPPRATPACKDATAPRSIASRRALHAGRSQLTLYGTSTDGGCDVSAAGAGVKRVLISIAKVRGRGRGRTCRFVLANGHVARRHSDCRHPKLLPAQGTAKWSFALKAHLKPGRYRLVVRAVDANGNRESPASGKNAISFRVR